MGETTRGFKPYTQKEIEEVALSYDDFRVNGYLNKNGSLKRGAIKIGAFYAIIPPSRLSVFERSDNQVISTLRQPGNVKLKQARLDTTIQVELVFPDLESINNNFRPILAQFIRAPFVPIDNYHLNMLLNPTVKWDIDDIITEKNNNGIITRTFKDDYIDGKENYSRAFTEYINNSVMRKIQERRDEVKEKVKELKQELEDLLKKLNNEQDEQKKDELQIEFDIKTQKYNEYVNEYVTNYDENREIEKAKKDLLLSEQEEESDVFIVAMQNITVNNIPGYSQALQCTLTFNIMTALPYSNDFSFLRYNSDFIKQNMYYSSRKYLRFPKSWRELNDVHIYKEPKEITTTTDLSKSEPFIDYLKPLLTGNNVTKHYEMIHQNDSSPVEEENITIKNLEIGNEKKEYSNLPNHTFVARVINNLDGDNIKVDLYPDKEMRLQGYDSFEIKDYGLGLTDNIIKQQNFYREYKHLDQNTDVPLEKIFEIGEQHRKLLEKYCPAGKKIKVEVIGTHFSGRPLVRLYDLTSKECINQTIIEQSKNNINYDKDGRQFNIECPVIPNNNVNVERLSDIDLHFTTTQNWLRMATNDDFNSIDMKLNIIELTAEHKDFINDVNKVTSNFSEYMAIEYLQNFNVENSVIKSVQDLLTIFGEDVNYILKTIQLDVSKNLLNETDIRDTSFENEPFTLSRDYLIHDKKGNTYKITKNASESGQWTYRKLLNKFKKLPGFSNFILNSKQYYQTFLELSLRAKYGYQTDYHLEIGTSKDTVITGMTASMSHKMAPIWMQLYDYPIFQHIGRNDFAIELNLQTCDAKFLSALRDLSIKYNQNRRRRGESRDPYFISEMNSIELDLDLNSNGFFKILGIGNVIPESIAMQTIPGKPGWIDVNMVLLQNDINIHKVEELVWTNKFNQQIINNATKKLMESYVCKANTKYKELSNTYSFLTQNLFPVLRNFAFKHIASIMYKNVNDIPNLSNNELVLSLSANNKVNSNRTDTYVDANNNEYENINVDLYNFPIPFASSSNPKELSEGYRITDKTKDNSNGTYGITRTRVTAVLSTTSKAHHGIDITTKGEILKDKKGPAIPANIEGKVVYSNYLTDFGNTVIIEKNINNFKFQFCYAHLAEPSSLKVNDYVKTGNLIGYMGRTGSAFVSDKYTTHLHYEVRLKEFDSSIEAAKSKEILTSKNSINPQEISIKNNQLCVKNIKNKEQLYDIEVLLKDTQDHIYHQDLLEKLKYIIDDIDVENLYHNLYSEKFIFDIVKAYIFYTFNRDFKEPTFINLLKKANEYYCLANNTLYYQNVDYNNLQEYYNNSKFNDENKQEINDFLYQLNDNFFTNYIKYCCENSTLSYVHRIYKNIQNSFNVSSIRNIISGKPAFNATKAIINGKSNEIPDAVFKTEDIIPVGESLNMIQQKYTNGNHVFTSLTGALKQALNLNVPNYYGNIKDSIVRSLILKYIQFSSAEFLNWYNNNLNDDKKITLVDLLAVKRNDDSSFISNYSDMELPYISGAYNSTTVDFYFKRFNDTVDFSMMEDKLNLYLDSAKNSWKFNNIKGIYLSEVVGEQLPNYQEYIDKINLSKNFDVEFEKDGTINDDTINQLLNVFKFLSNTNALPDSNTSEKYIKWLKKNSELNQSNITQQNLNTYQFLNEFIDVIHLQESYNNLNLQSMSKEIKDKQIERMNTQLVEKVQSLKSILATPLDKINNIYTPYTMANYYDILNRLKMDYNNYKGRNRERCVENCFPTAKLYFIEEDNKSWQKLDDYYSYDAIEDIKVVKSAKSAADYCELTISNLSETITNPLAIYKKENIIEDNTEKEQQIESIFLSEGTTIMVKLGYDNNPDLLDRVFMGKIVSIEYGDRVYIKAQGFGAELHEPINNGLPDRVGVASSMKLHGDLVEFYISSLSSLDHFGARSILERLGIEDNYAGYPSQDRFNSLWSSALNSIKSTLFKQYLPVLNLFKTIGTYDPRLENIYLSYSNSESIGNRVIKPIEDIYNEAKKDAEKKGLLKSIPKSIFNATALFSSVLPQNFKIGEHYGWFNVLSKMLWNYDFAWVIPENYSFWDLLSEIKNYYPDYILTVLPYNDWIEGRQRDTIYLGPRKGYYKYTDVFDNSQSSLEFTSHIQTIRDFERKVYNPEERAKFEKEYLKMQEEQEIINNMGDSNERIIKQKEFDKKYKQLNYLLKIICKKSYELLDSDTLHKQYEINDVFTPTIEFYSNVLDRFKVDVIDAEYITEGSVLDAATKNDETTNIKWRINNPDDLLDYDENGNLKEAFPQYQQVQNYYIVNSYSQIISNNITASSEDIYNKVIVTYPKDPTTNIDKHNESSSYIASDSISPSNIKTKVVHQNNVDPTNIFIPFLTDFLQKWNADWSTVGELRYAYLPPSTYVGYNILADSMRPMYRGTIELLGMPELKPYDILQINDVYNQMDGPIEIEQVIHHYSQNGFTTTIIPSAIVNTKDPSVTQELYLKKGFNLPIFGNVNGANLFSMLQNLSGTVSGIIASFQAVMKTGAFAKNSKELVNKLQNQVENKITKIKSLKNNNIENAKYIEQLENKIDDIAKNLNLYIDETQGMELTDELMNTKKEIEHISKQIKDLKAKKTLDDATFKQELEKIFNESKVFNPQQVKYLENMEQDFVEINKLKRQINISNININKLKNKQNKTINDIEDIKKQIEVLKKQKFIQSKKSEYTKYIDQAIAKKSESIEKIETELNAIEKDLKTYIKNNNIRSNEINKIIDRLMSVNNKYMAWIEAFGELYNIVSYFKNIKNYKDVVNQIVDSPNKLLNYSIYPNSYETINNGLSTMNMLTNATAMGLNIASMSKLFGPLKLASTGLLTNPWTVGILLFAEAGFAWLNAVTFNWGLGKVLGRNCIYVTPLNLNRAPMIAGLKGYNVYTDIETHINDQIFSLINAPKEYLAGVLSDDTSFN